MHFSQDFNLVEFLKGGCSHNRVNDYWIESVNAVREFFLKKDLK